MADAIKDLVVAAVRLAIVRHGLATDDCPTIGDEDAGVIAEDVWGALNGVGTCTGRPAPELLTLAPASNLQARLDAIKKCWQDGIGQLDNPWRRKMAELVGDTEGLAECPKLTEDSPIKTVFAHEFFRKAPAFRSLEGNDRPHADHLRACLMELARYVLARLDYTQNVLVQLDRIEPTCHGQ